MKYLTFLFLISSSLSFCEDDQAIPEKIYKQIMSKAEERWPNDYRMQKYCINSEIKDYISINNFKYKMQTHYKMMDEKKLEVNNVN